jgi:hypothetical protein
MSFLAGKPPSAGRIYPSAPTAPLISTAEYQYKFKTWQAHDLDARRLVVAGSGTILNGDQKERFLFTATIQDNRDGTLAVTYVASRPDASFIIPLLSQNPLAGLKFAADRSITTAQQNFWRHGAFAEQALALAQ